MLEQPIPDVSSADVSRVLQRDFNPDRADEAFAIIEHLAEDHRESTPRVQLAVLKLAQGDLSALRRYAKAAQQDFRDVLAWAEYPRYMKEIPMSGRGPAEEEARVIEDDWRQYQSWLTRQ